jgi:hypothetical protein
MVKMVCIKDCKLPGKDYIIRFGDNVVVDTVDVYGGWIGILKSETEESTLSFGSVTVEKKDFIPMYSIPITLVKEHFITLADWRDKQIDKILDDET